MPFGGVCNYPRLHAHIACGHLNFFVNCRFMYYWHGCHEWCTSVLVLAVDFQLLHTYAYVAELSCKTFVI